ncbi:hypothetical protein vseg_001099 [Gypsophila vaccaria]
MGGDKHGSKSGRYVGGFLQLFDWNAKSRKKLFPSRSDLPEQPKQGKKCEGNLPMTRMRVEEEDGDFGAGLSIRGGSEYSYASSLTDDDGYGTKAPGVVARLMGLDSMPTTSGADLYPSPFFDTHSLQDVPFRGQNIEFSRDYQVMHSSHMSDKGDSSSKIATVSRPRTTPSRPIEKFQSEMLPSRSAKTIPITHHKLLSPIKSPIFVSSRDSVHIMEAAAKIIEPGPQATSRAKISSIGSSSVPFKVREMREKLEAAQAPGKAADHSYRQVESNAAKNLRGQPMNKSWNGGTVDATSFKVSPSRDETSSTAKSKGKSISLAIQAKVNVQKREGLISSRSITSDEQDDARSTQLFRNQASSSKSSNRNSVLRQNNQKQNCPQVRDKPASKTSASTSTGKKEVTKDISHGRHKSSTREGGGVSRTNSRKSGLHSRDSDKGTPYSGARNVPRKKRSIDGSLNYNRDEVTYNMPVKKHENPSQSSIAGDRQFAWIEENRRKGMDVVSFSFSAPITRSLPVSEPLRQLAEQSSGLFADDKNKTLRDSDISKLSSPGFNGLRGDALSVLLEQKLKELASNLGNPHSFVNTSTPGSVESSTGKGRENGMSRQIDSGLSSEFQSVRRTFNFQAGEALEDYSNNTETKQWNPHLPSPVSILEPSMLTESCYSSESLASGSTEESKPCSSVLAQEIASLSSIQKFCPTEIDMDTSDSASSTTCLTTAAKNSTKTIAWELGYVKNILCNVELMFKDYVTGRTREVVNPHLFDQMERRTLIHAGSKPERKVLFDCVGECLDLKCQRFVGGGFDMWTKGIAMLKRNDRVAEEVYKEIQGWKSLGNCMVDELVDKDMSSKYGRWLDFEVDEFMLGVDIEGQILDSLVAEIVTDMFPFMFLSFQ